MFKVSVKSLLFYLIKNVNKKIVITSGRLSSKHFLNNEHSEKLQVIYLISIISLIFFLPFSKLCFIVGGGSAAAFTFRPVLGA